MNFAKGERVRIDGGWFHGRIGTFEHMDGDLFVVAISPIESIHATRVLPPTANNGD